MTIAEFLEARISEDESVIERRGSFPHSIHSSDIMGTFSAHCADCLGLPGRARVVAECAAKRAIMKEHELDLHSSAPYCDGCAEWWASELGEGPPPVQYPCPTIRAVAAVYADHPDYLPEWAR